MNTLRRWYSTVRGLMKSWPADLGVRMTLRSEAGDLRLLRGEHVARLDRALAYRLAGGRQLATSALGERLGPDVAEHLVGDTKLLARVEPAVLATQPLAVHEVGAGEMNNDAAARQPLDRLAVEGFGGRAVAQQRA